MQVGLLLNPQCPPGVAADDVWRQNFRIARLADRLGFSSLHVPEHHGRPDGHMPQPLLACAALATITERARIGTTVTLPALRHPVHVAEELSVLDVLSGGRAEIGVGVGSHGPEFAMFGLDVGEAVARFAECVEALTLLLSGPEVTFAGTHFQFADVTTMPRPVQEPHPPVWVGAISPAGARRAARLGVGLLLDPIHKISELQPVADAYHESCEKHGTAPRVTLMRWTGLDGNRKRLREEWWPRFASLVATYTTEIPRFRHGASENFLDFDNYETDRLLVGDANEIEERAAKWLELLRAERLIVKLQGPGGPSGAALDAVVEGFGSELLAALGNLKH